MLAVKRGRLLKAWAARVSTAAVATLLPIFAVPLAWSIVAAAEDPRCPFAGQRPPLEEILKLPSEKRPPLCRADFFRVAPDVKMPAKSGSSTEVSVQEFIEERSLTRTSPSYSPPCASDLCAELGSSSLPVLSE